MGLQEQIDASETVKIQYNNLIDELKKLTKCPILEIQMDDPSITLSGHTIDGGVMNHWITTGIKDNWDPSLTCNSKITNLAVKQLISLINDIENINLESQNKEETPGDV
jgi:hypothetical protein